MTTAKRSLATALFRGALRERPRYASYTRISWSCSEDVAAWSDVRFRTRGTLTALGQLRGPVVSADGPASTSIAGISLRHARQRVRAMAKSCAIARGAGEVLVSHGKQEERS